MNNQANHNHIKIYMRYEYNLRYGDIIMLMMKMWEIHGDIQVIGMRYDNIDRIVIWLI